MPKLKSVKDIIRQTWNRYEKIISNAKAASKDLAGLLESPEAELTDTEREYLADLLDLLNPAIAGSAAGAKKILVKLAKEIKRRDAQNISLKHLPRGGKAIEQQVAEIESRLKISRRKVSPRRKLDK